LKRAYMPTRRQRWRRSAHSSTVLQPGTLSWSSTRFLKLAANGTALTATYAAQTAHPAAHPASHRAFAAKMASTCMAAATRPTVPIQFVPVMNATNDDHKLEVALSSAGSEAFASSGESKPTLAGQP
jgi:hypothetical protein